MQVTSQCACGKLWQCWWWCSLFLYYSGFRGDTKKKQRTAWIQLGTESPGAEYQWWPWGMSEGSNPVVCLSFSTCPVPGLLGSRGQWGARNFRPSEAEILLQPKGASSRSAAPLCFPSWSSTRRQPSKLMGPAPVRLPLTCMQALHPNWARSNVLEILHFFSHPGKMKTMKCHQVLKFLCFFECELYWF